MPASATDRLEMAALHRRKALCLRDLRPILSGRGTPTDTEPPYRSDTADDRQADDRKGALSTGRKTPVGAPIRLHRKTLWQVRYNA